jgi:mRNA-degrading endonuclease RelE of RelBE toxin-antitoxin system
MLLMHGANVKEKNEQCCVLRICTVYSCSYSNILVSEEEENSVFRVRLRKNCRHYFLNYKISNFRLFYNMKSEYWFRQV